MDEKDEEYPDVTLDTLNDGVAREYFGLMMEKVKENIRDPNTPWKAKRTLTLTVTFKPTDDQRDRCDVTVTPTVKLAAVAGHIGRIALGFVMGKLTARVVNPAETQALPFTPRAVEKKAVNL